LSKSDEKLRRCGRPREAGAFEASAHMVARRTIVPMATHRKKRTDGILLEQTLTNQILRIIASMILQLGEAKHLGLTRETLAPAQSAQSAASALQETAAAKTGKHLAKKVNMEMTLIWIQGKHTIVKRLGILIHLTIRVWALCGRAAMMMSG
jgi:hypothetical protein